ncbi:hypothetical protein [Phytomonospora endophytica]|uniref:Uncharacterized protein n=1 Tax=Phytomonospora endophytica TaxID=714109 RepID=A0A841FXV4_9ACTN|nr:hypothetical protein [Phytomonospora endophytica]MBB6039553.1 hypothetical protein [Phytomonospora endophytica]GIG70517.1 hypothetical protein Pen01_68120 [Phytomonospora endophytica]
MDLTVESLPSDEDRSPAPVVLFRLGVIHQFRQLLADAEGIDLPSMLHHGGTTTWDTIASSLRPLLDFGYVDTGRIPVAACARMLPRLAEVAGFWRETGLAGSEYAQSPEWWQARLHQTVEELLEVLRRAVADDRDVILVELSP